ncbi:type I-F CRISPR-associated helicase Cas3f [Luteolibacter algae]|uniref:Type I-F CRISPR-associated helicase Cas3f n=1 Tax=Luteolibacter algae TaxID=454151 RepID=A0ABW5D9X3_9BACT
MDHFGQRIGRRTWLVQTTEAGMETFYRMLRKSARRNSAVACHWIKKGGRAELLWTVGKRGEFNSEGLVATHTTARDIVRSADENEWHAIRIIDALVGIAALFHDFGKACDFFQTRLRASLKKKDTSKFTKNPYRHEWISLEIFVSFVAKGNDADWIARLSNIQPNSARDAEIVESLAVYKTAEPFGKRLANLPPLAKAVAWLILSHHRMPLPEVPSDLATVSNGLDQCNFHWNNPGKDVTPDQKDACFLFENGLPFASRSWCQLARATAGRVPQMLLSPDCCYLSDPHVLHAARLCLMLADHIYSSEATNPRYGDPVLKDSQKILYANTDGKTKKLKQRLDEHLIGVTKHARRIVYSLPRLKRDLPTLGLVKNLRKRSSDARFRWQDEAFELASSCQRESKLHGFFGVNMASTGTGKTLANARIMYALSEERNDARFTIAIGLRSLTLQTGEEYRKRLKLDAGQLGIMVGGGAGVRRLFEENQDGTFDQGGSESADYASGMQGQIDYNGPVADGPLKHWLSENEHHSKLISTPLLVTTVDHLISASESMRGGRQIAPILRLMNSDLVLDEPDDFDLNDMPAITRLVHFAGLFGSRVLLSSATLPPDFIEALFLAYQSGHEVFRKNHGLPQPPSGICCAWFDENDRHSEISSSKADFAVAHAKFTKKRSSYLATLPPRRRAEIVSLPYVSPEIGFSPEILLENFTQLHHLNATTDPVTGAKVSFGLFRMANIAPLITTALSILASAAPEDFHIHLCCYHSRHPLLIRSDMEAMLDACLNRKDETTAFSHPSVRTALDKNPAGNHIFLVIASPVAEVGRDHDYDWAVVEPSSQRSIIQLAGRIRRHRPGKWEEVNLRILNENRKAQTEVAGKPVFLRPGFEDDGHVLSSRKLDELLRRSELETVDSRPRIQRPENPNSKGKLTDFEHQRIQELFSNDEAYDLPPRYFWDHPRNIHLTAALQKLQPFRKNEIQEVTYYLAPEDGNDNLSFMEIPDRELPQKRDNLYWRTDVELSSSIHFWGESDIGERLKILAEKFDIPLARAARDFATISLVPKDHGWHHHLRLGFWERK